MKAVPTIISLVVSASLALSGCKKDPPALTPAAEGPAPSAPAGMPTAGPLRPDQKELPPGHPPIGGVDPSGGAALGGNTAGEPIAGKIKETMDAGSYTYVLLTTAKGDVWAAVPKTKVAVGDDIKVVGASLQKDFQSPTLKRTFPEIWFGMLGDGATAPPGGQTGEPKPTPPPEAPAGPVPKADGPNAKTIAEVYADPAALTGKDVAVRGRVVKYNEAILGKNWIHIQDGSGDAAKGSNDLTITTQDKAAVGDVVTVTGKVNVNQDFGAGYKYAVIVEQATLAR